MAELEAQIAADFAGLEAEFATQQHGLPAAARCWHTVFLSPNQ